jgi:hypothetical protein
MLIFLCFIIYLLFLCFPSLWPPPRGVGWGRRDGWDTVVGVVDNSTEKRNRYSSSGARKKFVSTRKGPHQFCRSPGLLLSGCRAQRGRNSKLTTYSNVGAEDLECAQLYTHSPTCVLPWRCAKHRAAVYFT